MVLRPARKDAFIEFDYFRGPVGVDECQEKQPLLTKIDRDGVTDDATERRCPYV
jgi:hypothetical protein